MAEGLLGSFDNVMAGLTADELAALADPVAVAPPVADAPAAAPPVDGPEDPPAVAPHRVVDPRAQEVADRLLRRTRPIAHDSVVVPDRSSVVGARLVVIADQPGDSDAAGHDDTEVCTISDGDTIVIGRGETARQVAPHEEQADSRARPSDHGVVKLLVPYGVVSRQHCRVSRTGDVACIADTGSANGTVIVRDAQVVPVGGEPVPLVNGDVVATAGGHRPFVRFEIHPEHDAATAPNRIEEEVP
ncbi:MAG TPA: FHA domain-containing protein [Ilumatobacter sp.]|nr:FHA domain-containing protein [Ilumatobacter sp.]